MAKPTLWKDEYTLLCEKCGYVLEGLDTAGPCPECGMAITESIADLMTGTSWQRNPNIRTLVKTWWSTVFHPLKSITLLREHTPKHLAFIITTCMFASIVFIFGVFGQSTVFAINVLDVSPFGIFLILVGFAINTLKITFLLVAFTLLELHTLIFLRLNRGTSGSKEMTKSIITHASTGWIVAAILIVLALHVGDAVVSMNTESVSFSSSDFDTYEAMLETMKNAPEPYTPNWAYILGASLRYIGLLSGFLYFQFFTYLGLRRCKYANRIRPQEQTDG